MQWATRRRDYFIAPTLHADQSALADCTLQAEPTLP